MSDASAANSPWDYKEAASKGTDPELEDCHSEEVRMEAVTEKNALDEATLRLMLLLLIFIETLSDVSANNSPWDFKEAASKGTDPEPEDCQSQ